MNDQQNPLMTVLLIGGLAFLLLGNPSGCPNKPDPTNPTIPIVKATAATYVYEKSSTAIPSPVLAALDKLNRDRFADSFVASVFEQDTTDGTGETPEQYKVPLREAKASGLPSLVVTAGATVVKVVRDPKTEQDVIGAVP